MSFARRTASASSVKVEIASTGPKISSRRMSLPAVHARHDGRLVEGARPVDRRAAGGARSPRGRPHPRRARRPWRPPSSSMSGPIVTPSSVPRPTFSAVDPLGDAARRTRRRPTRARGSGSPPCTPRRCCGTSRASPPSTALSRSASSKTRNGALPPSSIEVRSTLSRRLLEQLRPDLGRAGERSACAAAGRAMIGSRHGARASRS